jgi:hypothetical protein
MPEEPASEAAATAAQPAGANAARQYIDAQQRYAQAIAETQVALQKVKLDAEREYATRLQEAQRDLERFNAEAYQNLLAAQVERTAGGGSGRLRETYQDYVRLTNEVFNQNAFRDEIAAAYQEVVAAVAEAKGQSDAAEREAAAHRAYAERLEASWKSLEALQRDAAQAYGTILNAWSEEISRQQADARTAWQTFLDNLKEAYERSDYERRAAGAANDYLNALQEAWKDAQNVHTDVALGVIEAQKSAFEELRRG